MTQQEDPLLPQQHLYIPDRGTYIPSWCKWRTNGWERAVDVTQDGKSLGFKVEQVLPERRWAIEQSGELLSQIFFESEYKRYLSGFIVPAGVKLDAEPIPCVERWVRKTVDPTDPARLIDIGFDPLKPAEEKQEAKYNQEGDLSFRFLAEQKEASQRLAKTDQLKDLRDQGIITDAQYFEQVEALQPVVEVEARAVVGPEPEPEVPKTNLLPTLCGEQRQQGASIRMHEMRCKKCNQIKEKQAAEGQ